MNPQQALAERVWRIFTAPTPPQRQTYLEKIAAGKLSAKESMERIAIFSAFNREHAKAAGKVVARFIDLAGTHPTIESIGKTLDEYEKLKKELNPDLLYYALEVFITHLKIDFTIPIPSLLVREPEKLIPTYYSRTGKEIAVGSEDETSLDWFREDPLLNEHHGHWHVVYNKDLRYDRQGEMFFYMHQQMLARYDTERIALGVPRVKAFNDMVNQMIQVGYTTGPDERIASAFGFNADRKVRAKVDEQSAALQIAQLKEATNDIDNGVFDMNNGIDNLLERETDAINRLGGSIESNGAETMVRSYSNYHGNGHVYIGTLNNSIGVMLDTNTAIRDVIFWEWHKGVDELGAQLQNRFGENVFSSPIAEMRKGVDARGNPFSPDIILCRIKDIPGWDTAGFNGQQIGDLAFNGENWDKEFPENSVSYRDPGSGTIQSLNTTDVLETKMEEAKIAYIGSSGPAEYVYPYLTHDEFCIFIRLKNPSLEQKKVTVRIFIVAEQYANDRSMWIELDKFFYELMGNSNTVIFRRDDQSSVIRKPAVKNPAENNIEFDPVNISAANARCNCGWPYHLLLPRGNKSGMPFKLAVVVTDGVEDSTIAENDCGSLSFCGATDNLYPDKRPLGYPFNRKFSAHTGAIIDALTAHANMGCRTIYIKDTTS